VPEGHPDQIRLSLLKVTTPATSPLRSCPPTRVIPVQAEVISRIDRDSSGGVEPACSLVDEIRDSGRFYGVHLIPVSRYRDVATRVERLP
jgi:hypothetical protein